MLDNKKNKMVIGPSQVVLRQFVNNFLFLLRNWQRIEHALQFF